MATWVHRSDMSSEQRRAGKPRAKKGEREKCEGAGEAESLA